MNKTVLITGASSGIGLATAKYLSTKGYDVLGCSRKISTEPCFSKYFACDISNPSSVQSLFEAIQKDYPSLYALINCAGMGISGAVEYTTLEEVKTILDVNLVGQFLITKAAIPLLRKEQKSRIINISSVAGELIIPFQTFYSMTKSAMNAFTEGLKNELRPFGIGVVSVLPGDTKTDFTKNRQKSAIETDALYLDRIARSVQKMEHDEEHGVEPEVVSKVIHKALKKKTLPVMMTVGFSYQFFVFLKRFLPRRLVSWLLYQMYGK